METLKATLWTAFNRDNATKPFVNWDSFWSQLYDTLIYVLMSAPKIVLYPFYKFKN